MSTAWEFAIKSTTIDYYKFRAKFSQFKKVILMAKTNGIMICI